MFPTTIIYRLHFSSICLRQTDKSIDMTGEQPVIIACILVARTSRNSEFFTKNLGSGTVFLPPLPICQAFLFIKVHRVIYRNRKENKKKTRRYGHFKELHQLEEGKFDTVTLNKHLHLYRWDQREGAIQITSTGFWPQCTCSWCPGKYTLI